MAGSSVHLDQDQDQALVRVQVQARDLAQAQALVLDPLAGRLESELGRSSADARFSREGKWQSKAY